MDKSPETETQERTTQERAGISTITYFIGPYNHKGAFTLTSSATHPLVAANLRQRLFCLRIQLVIHSGSILPLACRSGAFGISNFRQRIRLDNL